MRILLADQHYKIRLALAVLFDKEPGVAVTGSAGEPKRLLALAQTTLLNIINFDIRRSGPPLTGLLTKLRIYNEDLKMLLLGCVLYSQQSICS